ncbi:MAG: glycosyltransferase family 4 protein [Pirellulaceae bacterium]
MRIVYLHPHFTTDGGAGRMVLETGRRLADRGHRVDCVCIRAARDIVGNDSRMTFHEIGGPSSSQIPFWLGFRAGCKRIAAKVKRITDESNGECVLFPQVFPANWWGSYVLTQLPHIPCIWFCQEPSAFIHSSAWIGALPFPKNWIARLLNPFLAQIDVRSCQKFRTVMVNSLFSQEYARQVYGYPPETVVPVSLGVDHGRFKPRKDSQRSQAIVVFSKLTRFKNVDRIIAAFELLAVQRADLRLHIVGDGDAQAALHRQANACMARQRIEFHGRVSDTRATELLQDARVLCLASDNEPFGLVVVEALACGTPVVAMNSGGPAEILGEHGCGLLVDSTTPQALAAALKVILDSDERFQQFSSAALHRAADFHWENVVDSLEAKFEQLISAP